ncbi:hypothetical protein C8Q79DRAFT_395471 [Trametes meyenii]|nr:hypothetical protein C8Q79DRAFT_395471 [Trametes meyenii]
MIPKPYGTAGKHYSLREAMGLKDDKAFYNDILDTVRNVVIQGHLDFKVGIRQQHPATLGAVYELARDAQPYLSRFINDWATAQIIIQFLANRRKDHIENGKFVVTTDENGRRIVKDASRRVGRVQANVPSIIDRVAQAASTRRTLAEKHDVESSSDEDSDDSNEDLNDSASILGLDAGEDGEDVVEGAGDAGNAGMASGISGDDEGAMVRADDIDDLPLPPAKKRKLAHVPVVPS